MKIAYVDVETTGTDPALHEVWELAVIKEDDGIVASEFSTFVQPTRLNVADPRALEVGGFLDRFPKNYLLGGEDKRVTTQYDAAEELCRSLRGYRLASCNVAFDSAFLRALMLGEHGSGWPVTWHYSPIDVKSLCYGVEPTMLGASTDALLALFGISEREGHHTAYHDARLARELMHRAIALQRDRVGLPYSPEDLRLVLSR